MSVYYNFQKYIDRLTQLPFSNLKQNLYDTYHRIEQTLKKEEREQLAEMLRIIGYLMGIPKFRPFVIENEQLEQLVSVKAEDVGDMKLPFDEFCIELGDKGIDIGGENPVLLIFVKKYKDGARIIICTQRQLKNLKETLKKVKKERSGKLKVHLEEYLFFESYIRVNDFSYESIQDSSRKELMTNGTTQVREIISFLYNFCKFLESDNVETKITKLSGIKKRAKKGLPPLLNVLKPNVILTKHQQQRVNYLQSHIEGTKHRFRYDVRGHFKRFTTGKMSGKILWCPPHQRGLTNQIYRPAIRKV